MSIFRRLALAPMWVLCASCSSASMGGPPDLSAGGDQGIQDLAGFQGNPDLELGPLAISPLDQTLTVTVGQPLPTLQYAATAGGVPITPSWSIDRREIGAIAVGGGLFTPTGNLAGKAHITASYGAQMVSTSVTVQIVFLQIGDPNFGMSGTPGPGGYGGVGGNGPGGPATVAQQNVLNGAATVDAAVRILYPYDQTVWPRGLLAPLLQWNPGAHAFDSLAIHIQQTNFDYRGFFSAPNAKPFVNLPIPQGAWTQMTYSNGGGNVTVTLTFAQGAKAYGPYTLTWKVAPGTLKGTVYYNSYGTSLVKNSGQASFNGGPPFGGATLSIKPGATDPTLVAGTPSADNSGCRVCHSVSANGALLMTQHGSSYPTASLYALTLGNQQTVMTTQSLNFSALFPDGTLLFSDAGGMAWADSTSRLYSLPSGTLLAASGLPLGLQGTLPSFSPDGKHVAFNLWAGPGADKKSLALLDFDVMATKFSGLRKLATPTAGPSAWPSFLPTSDAVLYEVETVSTAEYGFTRSGIRGELWSVGTTVPTTPARLDQLNGKGYLPTGPNNHADDTTLNYEPTLNPIVSGGYAWVVFTSRRLYGNVATLDPWSSDPRNFDLANNITTKKLWVAAVDLNAPAGSDPSHPAFYLPAQELYAGNSRGFWSVDPCHPDNTNCVTGDECCGGYCQPGDGGFVCSSTMPMCAQVYEKCTVAADCCGVAQGVVCINGLCGYNSPPLQ